MPRHVKRKASPAPADDRLAAPLRIIGGKLRGRKLVYNGDQRTRPMKDRVREAVFNLVGPRIIGSHAIDLFAGTGALGLEAVSRGAKRATLIEQHFPTARIIRENAETLGVADQCEVAPGDSFVWAKRAREVGPEPWVVFCSPPYAFYVDRQEQMLTMITTLIERAPPGSMFVVEADGQFDFGLLPEAAAWDVRSYLPAVVGVMRKQVRAMNDE